MLQDNAIHVRVLVVGHRTRVQGVTGGTRSVFAHPNIEVFVARPLNERLHFRIAHVRQVTDNAVDAGVTISVGVPLRKTEFNLHIRHHILKFGNHLVNVGIQGTEVGVQNIHRIHHLCRRDVFWTVEMDDVEHDGNDEQFVALTCCLGQLRLTLEGTLSFQSETPGLRPQRKQALLGLVKPTR